MCASLQWPYYKQPELLYLLMYSFGAVLLIHSLSLPKWAFKSTPTHAHTHTFSGIEYSGPQTKSPCRFLLAHDFSFITNFWLRGKEEGWCAYCVSTHECTHHISLWYRLDDSEIALNGTNSLPLFSLRFFSRVRRVCVRSKLNDYVKIHMEIYTRVICMLWKRIETYSRGESEQIQILV